MRVINQNSKTTLAGSTPMDYLEALVVRELTNLAKVPQLTSKEIISLERLGAMLCRISADRREETMMLVKLGVKENTVNDKVLKEIEKILLNASPES
jgi:hypothetical protein